MQSVSGTPRVTARLNTDLWADSRYRRVVSAQRARTAGAPDATSRVDATQRSIHPGVPGVPWWAAVLIAVGATAVGFAIDAGFGHSELTSIFAAFYVLGCVAAALAVRQESVFTALIQPPLILFCAVPGAYWLFHGRKVGRLKDLLINCGYPLIERFPLMLGTAGGVLLIGLVRVYLGTLHRTADGAEKASGVLSLVGGVIAKLQSAVGRGRDDADAAAPDERRGARRARTARQPTNARRAGSHAGRSASRRGRPPSQDPRDPGPGYARRASRGGPAGPRDVDPADPSRWAYRPGPQGEPDRRQARRDPRTRINPYERPGPGRFDAYPPPPHRYPPREGYEGYEAYGGRGGSAPGDGPARHRQPPRGANGAPPAHHPISRVRYRGDVPPAADRPSRSGTPGRSRGRPPEDSWDRDA